MLQICRWLPARRLVFVGDSSFAVLDLLAAVRQRCAVISRLRLDANLMRHRHREGLAPWEGPQQGKPLPKLKTIAEDATTIWHRTICDQRCELSRVGNRAVVPLRQRRSVEMGAVRDPSGARPIQAFFSTDTNLSPEEILAFFVRRWQVEVTFAVSLR